jgi:hypothetical protein
MDGSVIANPAGDLAVTVESDRDGGVAESIGDDKGIGQ